MRVALVGQKGIPCVQGGIERYAEQLGIKLVERGLSVVAYTRPHYTDKKLRQYQGIELISLPSIRSKHLDAITHSLLATLHAIFVARVDIIHYMNIGPALLAWLPRLLRPKIKVIGTFQSMDWQHEKWGNTARTMLKLGALIMVRSCHQTFAVSQEIRNYVKNLFKRYVLTITNGVAVPKRLPALTRGQYLSELGLTADSYILSASRLIRHKGIHHLISAFKQLRQPGIKLVIAGDGFHTDDYVEELRELAAGQPDIIFTGKVEGQKLQSLFEGARAFVLPSEAEGLSLVLLEALAYGVPVLVSDIKPNLECISAAQHRVGFIFKKNNVADLNLQLERILSLDLRDRQRWAQKARQHAALNYSWDKITDEIITIYHEVIFRQLLSPVGI